MLPVQTRSVLEWHRLRASTCYVLDFACYCEIEVTCDKWVHSLQRQPTGLRGCDSLETAIFKGSARLFVVLFFAGKGSVG